MSAPKPATGTVLAAVDARTQAFDAIRRAADLPESYADERIEAIRSACVPKDVKATTSQLAMFLATAYRYNLDPMLGEIWLGVMDGQLRPVTGRNSFIKLAHNMEDYAGMESGPVFENDIFEVKKSRAGYDITHEIPGFNRGRLLGAYALLLLHGRPAIYAQKAMVEYKNLTNKKNWLAYPADMIETRAQVHVFRRAWPMSGLFTKDEAESGLAETAGLVETETARQATLSQAEQLRERLARVGGAAIASELEDSPEAEVVDEGPTPAMPPEPEPFEDGDAKED